MSWLWLIPAFVLGAIVGTLATVWALIDLKLKVDDARADGYPLSRHRP